MIFQRRQWLREERNNTILQTAEVCRWTLDESGVRVKVLYLYRWYSRFGFCWDELRWIEFNFAKLISSVRRNEHDFTSIGSFLMGPWTVWCCDVGFAFVSVNFKICLHATVTVNLDTVEYIVSSRLNVETNSFEWIVCKYKNVVVLRKIRRVLETFGSTEHSVRLRETRGISN